MIVVGQPDGAPQLPQGQLTHSVMVHIEDMDRHYARISQSGAHIISPPTDFPFGERQYTVEDLADHRWTFSQSIADIDPQAWGGVLIESDGNAS